MNLFSLTYYAWLVAVHFRELLFSPPQFIFGRRKEPKGRSQPQRKLTPGFGRYLLIFLLLFLFVPSVTAQGIGVSPNKLEIETFKGNEVKKQLTIFNPSNEKLDFFVKASDWFSFFPEEFSINPNENKKVVVKVKPDKNGEFEETINVLLNPQKNDGLAINLGAAVRVKIKSKTKTNHLVGAATTASIVICGLSLFLLRKNS